jgi:hypothetical protein
MGGLHRFAEGSNPAGEGSSRVEKELPLQLISAAHNLGPDREMGPG